MTDFELVVDTSAPASPTLAINAGAAYTSVQAVTANISTADSPTTGYTTKLWGSVDNGANANIQTTEGASSYIAYSTTQAVTLSSGDGTKTLNIKIKDDIGNITSTVTDTIVLDSTLPVPNITVAMSPTKVSKIATFDTATFSFESDSDIGAWKVKVVPATNSLENAGTTIPTTAGSANTTGTTLAASTPQQVTIKGTDLETASAGDGSKIVKVFVQDLAANWSI